MINLKFLLAGNATFTIANPEGKRYTFKITYSKGIKKHFAYVLTAPETYTYVGMVVDSRVVLTKKSKYTAFSKLFNVLNCAFDIASGKKQLKEGYFLEHMGKCGRCGRDLTTPESINRGLGPICFSK